jgi:nucleotide-binding universal stress UspA family protein
MTKRKALIPLDGSMSSRQIIAVVQAYLNPQETKLVLLRVDSPVVVSPHLGLAAHKALASSPYEVYAREMERAYTHASHVQAACQRQLEEEMRQNVTQLQQAGYMVSTEILYGDPAQRISDYVRDAKIDLVAMTTHGRTGLERFVLGSVAESVLRQVDVPLLLLRSISMAQEIHHSEESVNDL